MKFKPGDRVLFDGWTIEQVRWGNNDNPHHLERNKIYIIDCVEVHSQHTKVSIVGETGRFNSVHFIHA